MRSFSISTDIQASGMKGLRIALVIAIFGGVYAWLARQDVVNRPLLLVGALGKVGFFALAAAYWTAGSLPAAAVSQGVPDLVLGALFLWWLAASAP
jgi:hypothetical protein